MKKGFYTCMFSIFALGVLAAVPLRVCLILYAIDPNTGFYVAGSGLVTALNYLLLALTVILILPHLIFRQKTTPSLPAKSMPLGIMAGILSLALAVDSVYTLGNVFISKAGGGAFVTAIAEISTVIFFAVFAAKLTTTGKEKASSNSFAYAALLPIVWAALTLIITFMHYTTIANISEYLFDVLKMVFALLFFYYHARLVGKMPNGKELRGLFMMGLPAALFSLVATLPYYIAHIIDSTKGQAPQPGSIVYVVFAVYVLFVLAGILKRSNTPMETSAPIPPESEKE